MYVFSESYKNLQLTLSCLGIGSAGVVTAYGVMACTPVFIVGGILSAIPSAFVLFSGTKVNNDLVDYFKNLQNRQLEYSFTVRKLSTEIDVLQERLEAMQINKSTIINENKTLRKEYQKMEDSINELRQLKESYLQKSDLLEKELYELKTTNTMFNIENKELRESIDSLNRLKGSLIMKK